MVKAGLARMILSGGLALGMFAAAVAPVPAAARVVVGVGVGLPLFAPAYPPPVYYPPVYYAPAPPPPVYYYPPPAAAVPPAPAPAAAQCREYTTTSVIDGKPQQVFGHACLQPDGTWRIVD